MQLEAVLGSNSLTETMLDKMLQRGVGLWFYNGWQMFNPYTLVHKKSSLKQNQDP
jgi:hypothetical protein